MENQLAQINFTDFHFLRPWFLILLPIAAYILYKWLANKEKNDGWQQSCDPHLLKAMQIKTAVKGTGLTALYWPITLLAIVALAGPAIRKVPVPVIKNQAALVLALDVSKSMLSDDLKPSRLQRAKFKIQDLLLQRKDGQTALVVYSGDAFVVTPLTDDVETIIALLKAIDPNIMPTSGTNTTNALIKSQELLQQAGVRNGQILLITDGVKLHKTKNTLETLADDGIRVSVLAVGTEAGAPIRTAQGFLKDLTGQIVIPKLDIRELRQVAQAGGGSFNMIEAGNQDISNTLSQQAEQNDEKLKNQFQSEKFIDEGPWLLLLMLPLLALLYRRGALMALLLGINIIPQQAQALEWQDLWLNQDQKAWQNLQNQQPDQAFRAAKNSQIKAAAAYQQKQFKQASSLYAENTDSLDDYYNRGNALAQSGELEKALMSYEKALTYNPEDEDTLYNKNIVEQALKQQQEQEQQQQDQENQQQDSENQDSEQQQSDSEQQQNEQQENEQQENEQQENQQQQQQAKKDQEAKEQEAKDQEAKDQQQKEQSEQSEDEQQKQQEVELSPEEKALDAEEQQAIEQWLRRIKDDPGGLLRRKFLYQYHRRNQDGESYDNQQTTEDW